MGFLGKSQTMGVAALILAASTLLSRFMGLIRDKVISWQFGAGGDPFRTVFFVSHSHGVSILALSEI